MIRNHFDGFMVSPVYRGVHMQLAPLLGPPLQTPQGIPYWLMWYDDPYSMDAGPSIPIAIWVYSTGGAGYLFLSNIWEGGYLIDSIQVALPDASVVSVMTLEELEEQFNPSLYGNSCRSLCDVVEISLRKADNHGRDAHWGDSSIWVDSSLGGVLNPERVPYFVADAPVTGHSAWLRSQ